MSRPPLTREQTADRYAAIAAAYAAGASADEVGRAFGVGKQTVYNAVRRSGGVVRPRGRYRAGEPEPVDTSPVCTCTHTANNHRPRGGECLEDECDCTSFTLKKSVALESLDEPTADATTAEIPEVPGMGPTASVRDYGAVGPGWGVRCRCGDAAGDHRPETGECLVDECECVSFRPSRHKSPEHPKRRPHGTREQSAARHRRIVEEYVGGAASTTLAARYGVSREAVCVVLRRAGVIRPSHRRRVAA